MQINELSKCSIHSKDHQASSNHRNMRKEDYDSLMLLPMLKKNTSRPLWIHQTKFFYTSHYKKNHAPNNDVPSLLLHMTYYFKTLKRGTNE